VATPGAESAVCGCLVIARILNKRTFTPGCHVLHLHLQCYFSAKCNYCEICSGCSDILLEDNAVLAARLSEKALPTKEYFQFTTSDGIGTSLLFVLFPP